MTSSSSLFSGITSGLTSTYSILANASPSGVTLNSIATARSTSTVSAMLNPTFASYIQTNFSTLDTNHDGTLSAAELSNITSKMLSTGLTAAQISQLGTASGLSNDQIGQITEHFRDIDTNGDGKVTAAEIAAYKLTSAMQEKKTEFANRAATNQSVFYGSEDSNSTDSSSMLSFKNWNTGSSSSSNSNSSS